MPKLHGLPGAPNCRSKQRQELQRPGLSTQTASLAPHETTQIRPSPQPPTGHPFASVLPLVVGGSESLQATSTTTTTESAPRRFMRSAVSNGGAIAEHGNPRCTRSHAEPLCAERDVGCVIRSALPHDASVAYIREVSVVVTRRCVPCERVIADGEARRVRAGETEMLACPACGSALVGERSRVVEPIHAQLLGAFRYPFQPTTFAVVAGFGVVTGLLSLAGGIPAAFAFGLRCLYLFAVLRATAMGRDEPEIDPARVGGDGFDWSTRPTLRMLVTLAVAFLPALLAHFAVGNAVLTGALVVVGLAYAPAALIVTAHDDRVDAAVNPVPALRIIVAIPKTYAITCAFLVGLGLTSAMAISFTTGFAGTLVSSIVAFVPAVIGARMLGLLVAFHDEELVP